MDASEEQLNQPDQKAWAVKLMSSLLYPVKQNAPGSLVENGNTFIPRGAYKIDDQLSDPETGFYSVDCYDYDNKSEQLFYFEVQTSGADDKLAVDSIELKFFDQPISLQELVFGCQWVRDYSEGRYFEISSGQASDHLPAGKYWLNDPDLEYPNDHYIGYQKPETDADGSLRVSSDHEKILEVNGCLHEMTDDFVLQEMLFECLADKNSEGSLPRNLETRGTDFPQGFYTLCGALDLAKDGGFFVTLQYTYDNSLYYVAGEVSNGMIAVSVTGKPSLTPEKLVSICEEFQSAGGFELNAWYASETLPAGYYVLQDADDATDHTIDYFKEENNGDEAQPDGSLVISKESLTIISSTGCLVPSPLFRAKSEIKRCWSQALFAEDSLEEYDIKGEFRGIRHNFIYMFFATLYKSPEILFRFAYSAFNASIGAFLPAKILLGTPILLIGRMIMMITSPWRSLIKPILAIEQNAIKIPLIVFSVALLAGVIMTSLLSAGLLPLVMTAGLGVGLASAYTAVVTLLATLMPVVAAQVILPIAILMVGMLVVQKLGQFISELFTAPPAKEAFRRLGELLTDDYHGELGLSAGGYAEKGLGSEEDLGLGIDNDENSALGSAQVSRVSLSSSVSGSRSHSSVRKNSLSSFRGSVAGGLGKISMIETMMITHPAPALAIAPAKVMPSHKIKKPANNSL